MERLFLPVALREEIGSSFLIFGSRTILLFDLTPPPPQIIIFYGFFVKRHHLFKKASVQNVVK